MSDKTFPFIASYRKKKIEVFAKSSFGAQLKAAEIFKAKKTYEVTVMRADLTHSTEGL